MRITVLAVGHKAPGWVQEGFNEYARRMPPEARLELIELKPEERGAGRSVERARTLEGERILAAIPQGATLLALDERGKSVTTQGLSVMLADWMRDGSHPAFVIGGADGLSDEVKARAAKLVSDDVVLATIAGRRRTALGHGSLKLLDSRQQVPRVRISMQSPQQHASCHKVEKAGRAQPLGHARRLPDASRADEQRDERRVDVSFVFEKAGSAPAGGEASSEAAGDTAAPGDVIDAEVVEDEKK